MELRSSRSRSRTPSMSREVLENEVNHQLQQSATTRVTRSTTLKTIVETKEVQVKETNMTKSANNKSAHKSHYITSDYSSEDGEYESFSKNTATEHNGKNNGDVHEEELIALKVYREAQEYWNRFPKTDYTYSPHSKDRIELAPGIVNMPNMSRKSIHSNCETVTPVTSRNNHKETNTEYLEPERRRAALYTNNNIENRRYYSTVASYTRTQTVSIFTNVLITLQLIFNSMARPARTLNSSIVRLISTLHKFSSRIMLLDTWLLRAHGGSYTDNNQQQRTKIAALLALCLIPLLFFGGMWLLTTLGHVLSQLYAAAPLLSTTTTTKEQTPIIIRLDTPSPVGLTNYQIRQIAQSVKDNLDVDLDLETIMLVLQDDPNLQKIESVSAGDLAASLTDKQLRSALKVDENLIVDRILANPRVKKLMEVQNVGAVTASQVASSLNKEQLREALEIDENLIVEKLLENPTVQNLFRDQRSNLAQYRYLLSATRRCCRNNFLYMQTQLKKTINDILQSTEYKKHLTELLNARNASTQIADSEINRLVALASQKALGQLTEEVSKRSEGNLASDLQIRAIVKDLLSKYDADRTGLVDYALESGGGQILSTRCTEHYNAWTSVVSIFGIPLFHPAPTPRTVITPGVHPGECWAFQSFPGFIDVQLSHRITVEAFSYEHVNRNLVPGGKIDSAPKKFQVYGLENEQDKEPLLLGEYTYDIDGEPLQFFAVQVPDRRFQIVQLKIDSNHGNPNYTCLYRFRVHGKLTN